MIKSLPKLTRVLYVNADPNQLIQFRDTFNQHFKVFLASDDEFAFDTLNKESIDVIITEQDLPYTSGVELLYLSKITKPDIGRILITPGNDINVLIDAIQISDVFRFLIKPYRKKELIKTISELRYQQVVCKEEDIRAYITRN